MRSSRESVTILMADDDLDDCLLVKEAFEENHLGNELYFVQDGEALLDYLCRRGRYSDPAVSPRPGLILLDLNMPRKDGRQALREIRADPALQCIPIIILTTSKEDREVSRSYALGANSFITKPVSFEGLVEIVRAIGRYWLELVRLPGENKEAVHEQPEGEGPPDRG